MASRVEEGGAVIQTIPAHDDWGIVTAARDDWEDFAASLKARGQATQLRPGRPLDPRVARELLPDQVGAGAEGQEYQPVIPYLVVVNKRVRCLHRANGCWRACALSFKEFEFVELEPVPSELYTQYCRGCWPASAPGLADGSGDDSGVSSARSSSSSSTEL